MSENIPESIPTSHDPRSKRPTKRRALSPRAQRAGELEALFAKPDVPVVLPPSISGLTSSSTSLVPQSSVPEIVQNVQGSSAGAGSGEFHVYKASRRREYERLRGMDEEVRKEEESEKWEREKREREEKDAEVTRKKREKRKNKGKGGKGKTAAGGDVAGSGAGNGAQDKVGKPRMEIKPRTVGDDEQEIGGEVQQEVGIMIHDDD